MITTRGVVMDKELKESLLENLTEVKEYADKYPANAGWRWVSERMAAALNEIDPKEETKSEEGYDIQEPADPPKTEAEQIVEVIPPVTETPEEEE